MMSMNHCRSMSKAVFPDQFSLFWSLYPRRHGKRVGKQTTRTLFDQLSNEDQVLIIQAVSTYSKDEQVQRGFARDPERFLKKGWWRDWLEPLAQQCLRCEEAAVAGFNRCDHHLRLFVRAWQGRELVGIDHPRGLQPPTEKELEYVHATKCDNR